MKRSPIAAPFFALLLVSLMMLTACDANTLTGPETSPPPKVESTYTVSSDPPKTEPESDHNTGCPAGDPECS
ncbi:hypothetical protein [Longibacter sp.]|jgi:predicted small secreted protein|uniref:hypothetical protein n=1 Tax=Longibacter sp. TaxID=2045415 RepID=UPI003EBC936A